MKAFIACLFIASAVLAIHDTLQPSIPSMSSGLTMAEMKKINELKNTKWGNIFMTMAEMQLSAGPIERLVQALDDMLKELDKSLQEETDNYKQKEGAHEASVLQTNNQINEANREVASATLKIQNDLSKKKSGAELEIKKQKLVVQSREKDIANARDTRKRNKASFNERIAEHNKAIAAVDECIQLTTKLLGGQASFVEVKQATMSIRRLELRLRQTHETETPLIEALISLVSSQNFEAKENTNKVLTLLNQFRARLASSVQTEQDNESKEIDDHKNLLKQYRSEISNAQDLIRTNTKTIENAIKDIEAAQNVIDTKKKQSESLKAKLNVENEAWRKETETYKELVAQILKEIDVVKQCQILFRDARFSKYAAKKINRVSA